MPRIPTSLLRKAHSIDPFLPPLLAPCRDIHTAQNELRWLREHVDTVAKARRANGDTLAKSVLLRQLVKERASGKPLQYLIGTEYFGNLELRCRPGVLIPRPDTAASIIHLVGTIRNAQNLPSELRVLDLCTGTGCIPLLFQHELCSARKDVDLRILGVDVSSKALRLAKCNLKKVRKSKDFAGVGTLEFIQADILVNPFRDQTRGRISLKAALNHKSKPPFWDILISNPPYISPAAYWKTTTRSVRTFEPKLALVPPSNASQTDTEQGDMFYPPLLYIAQHTEAKIVLLEVADLEQALRVAQGAQALKIFDGIEIWREQPDAKPDDFRGEDDVQFSIIGKGNARSVICWRGAGASWLGKEMVPASHEARTRRIDPFSVDQEQVKEPANLEPQFDKSMFSWPPKSRSR